MATSVTLKPNAIDISGSTSGTTTLQASAVAGTTTLTLPAATDTLVGKATTDTLTNKTLTGAVMNGTLGATTPSTASVTTLTTSSTVTHSGGTANGVAYLDGSKVLTTGSALTFDGTNLGIGTSSPQFKLDTRVTNNTAYTTSSTGNILSLRNESTTAGTYSGIQFVAVGNGADVGTAHINAIQTASGSAALAFSTRNSATTAERMRLDSSGKLLLGVTSGTGLSNGDFAMGNGKSIRFRNAADSAYISAFEFTSANGLNIGTGGSLSTITFGISGIGEAGRFDTSGNLLVGVTSGTSYKLALKTSAASQSAIGTTGTSGDTAFQAILITKFDNDSTTSQNFIQFQINNGGANCGKITANGANTAAFGSTSDQRVKENIAELPSQLDNIMALRPVEFDYLESYGGGHQIGFIAQEMQQIYPDVISTDDSSEKIMSITGWSKTEARLVKAIQEQQAIIQSLTARITALEGA